MATTTTATTADTVKAAYDRAVRIALRPHLHFDGVADVRPTMQDKPGSSVQFTINTDLSANSTALDESTDVSPATLAASTVSVTLYEYGDAVEVTEKLLGTSFDAPAFDTGAAERIGFQAALSLDTLARDVLKGGTNVRYATAGGTDPTARNQIEPEDIINADNCRRAATDLYANNAVPFENGLYRAFIHPDVSYDLRRETGAAAWRDPHTYSDPGAIYNGSIGEFEGHEFISTPRAPIFADAGSSTTLTDVYATIFVGRESLAKAYSSAVSGEYPQVRIRPPVDILLRKHTIGWYWLGNYGRFREAAIRRVESSSSIGSN